MPNDEPAKLTLASSIAAQNQGRPKLLAQVRNTFRMLRNSKRHLAYCHDLILAHIRLCTRQSSSLVNCLSNRSWICAFPWITSGRYSSSS